MMKWYAKVEGQHGPGLVASSKTVARKAFHMGGPTEVMLLFRKESKGQAFHVWTFLLTIPINHNGLENWVCTIFYGFCLV